MQKDLDGSTLPPATVTRAKYTLKDFEIIFEELGNLRKIKSDAERAATINKITKERGGMGALEDTPNMQTLEDRIDLFVESYFKAKDKEKLDDFFSCFMRGDPCLNGRIINLVRFAAALEGIEVEDTADEDVVFRLPASILFKYIGDSEDINETKEYLLKHIDEIAEEFERKAAQNKAEAAPYLAYLEKNGLPKEGSWGDIIPKALNHKSFMPLFQYILKCS